MIDRHQIYIRTHAVVTRLELSPGGKAQALGQSISHAKPGSSMPDMSILADIHQLEAPLWRWLGQMIGQGGPLMQRFGAAIKVAGAKELDELAAALTQTETRLRIEWNGTAHQAMPPVALDELRETRQRMLLHKGFGMGTLELATAEGITRDDVRHVRRSHGIDGHNGTRKEKCPDAIVTHLSTDYCRVCQVVDDREAERRAA